MLLKPRWGGWVETSELAEWLTEFEWARSHACIRALRLSRATLNCLPCCERVGMSHASQLDGLLSWLSDKGVTWDAQKVDIRGGKNGAAPFAVFAHRDIDDSEALCDIPKSTVLSVKNTAIADLIEHEQLGGGLGLILAIMFECSIAEESAW